MKPGSLIRCLWLLIFAVSGVPEIVRAQDQWPNQPVRLVVGFPPGGPSDTIARIVGRGLSERIGQPVIVENRPGAEGNIAAAAVARSRADGYTLLYVVPNVVTNPFFLKTSLDPFEELAPVIQLVSAPMALLVNSQLPAGSLRELVDLVRSKPGAFSCGSAGAMPTIGCQFFRAKVDPSLLMVPYRGQAQVSTALMGGEINMMFDVVNTAAGPVSSGRVKVLATTAPKRGSRPFGDLPVVAEELPDFELTTWHGIMAPKTMPPDLVTRINREVAAVLHSSETRSRLTESGLEIAAGPPEAFSQVINRDYARFGPALKAAGVKAE